MSDLQTRPRAPAPTIASIPAELTARAQWVCWRYELRGDKWTKVPYTPGTTRKALSNRPTTWGTFPDALAAYRARADFFDGIGYMFANDDPYVGGDFDACLNADGALSDFARQHLPPTYAEVSPGGRGVKFIARGTILSGRKTAQAELYATGRFFTITGNVLPGHTTIAEAQRAIDALLAALPSTRKAPREGANGSGSRAEQATQVSEPEWDAACRLMRDGLDRLQRRLKAAVGGEETQLAYLLRQDYAGFQKKWPFVGLYRADGSLDDSQVRAVAANGIRGRGFSFAEYVALMSRLYAAQALAKWGTKARWREELVDQIYQTLLDHRAGNAAVIQIAELADVIHCHRRTISTILDELRAAGRISTRRLGRYGGLVISFPDMIYSTAPEAMPLNAMPEPDVPPTARDVIYAATREVVPPNAMPQNDAPSAAPEETKLACVSSDRAAADHISLQPAQRLDDLVREAIDCYGARLGRVLRYIADNSAGRSWPEPRIRRVYAWVIRTRRWSRRDAREAAKARRLSAAALKRVSQSFASQAATYAKAGDKRAPVWMRLAGIYAAEEARREPPDEPTIHELWAQVDPVAYAQARPKRQHRGLAPVARAAVARHTNPPSYDAPAMIARLKARRREAG